MNFSEIILKLRGSAGAIDRGRPGDPAEALPLPDDRFVSSGNPEAWQFTGEDTHPAALFSGALPMTLQIDPPWLAEARKLLGTKEGRGDSNNPIVVNFWVEAKMPWFKDDATAWCAGFVNAMLERTGFMGSRKANAKSFLAAMTGRVGLPRFRTLSKYRLGAVCVLHRPPHPGNGHVGFVVAHDQETVTLLGGNQGDSVSYSKFKKARVAGLRWPFEFPLPAEELAMGGSAAELSKSEA